MTFFAESVFILTNILLPVLLLVGLGTLIQKFYPLDNKTLSRIQVYGFVPAFLLVRVYESTLSWGDMGKIAVAVLLSQFALAVPLYLIMKARRVPPETLSVVLLASVVFNAGNFGIPVVERAFGKSGGAVQALVVMVANLSLWGIGYAVMAAVTGKGKGAVWGYFKLPMVYCLAIALVLRGLHWQMPPFLLYTLRTIAEGLVPLSLLNLGSQLGTRQSNRTIRWRAIAPTALAKLILLPVATAGITVLLGLWPWPGAVLVLAAAAPSAVNTLLLAHEQNGDVELAADCVFATTLLSVVTVTITLVLLRYFGGDSLPMPGPPQ
ncbi:MAG: AEC family transporter [Akkermansiaceae bacterium]|nr:AEC family transporter [Armatimonadota bacterium]